MAKKDIITGLEIQVDAFLAAKAAADEATAALALARDALLYAGLEASAGVGGVFAGGTGRNARVTITKKTRAVTGPELAELEAGLGELAPKVLDMATGIELARGASLDQLLAVAGELVQVRRSAKPRDGVRSMIEAIRALASPSLRKALDALEDLATTSPQVAAIK